MNPLHVYAFVRTNTSAGSGDQIRMIEQYYARRQQRSDARRARMERFADRLRTVRTWRAGEQVVAPTPSR
jgi:hypothetical protein